MIYISKKLIKITTFIGAVYNNRKSLLERLATTYQTFLSYRVLIEVELYLREGNAAKESRD